MNNKNSGINVRAIVLINLTNTCNAGPAVSLNGSPRVSPTTAALCASDPFPPYLPVSIFFFALSHAAPPVFIRNANKVPLTVALSKNAPTANGPNIIPTNDGTMTGYNPGIIISF